MTKSELINPSKSGLFGWRFWLPIMLVLLILPTLYTAPHIILKPENPEGDIDYPSNIESKSEGLVLIVLDGVGDEYLLSDDYMPKLNKYREESAILNVRTGPLTLSATCISEMMTGVPNSPINGLRNFDLNHPGGNDPWLAASNDDRYDVAMVGSYVMGNIYKQFDGINFTNTFKGHSDYYEGDKETFEIASDWIAESNHNVMAVHFSGPDKVGHSFGIVGSEYKEKLLHLDEQVSNLTKNIPENWSIIITADHGMTDIGSHGSAEEDTRNVVALILGPDIEQGTQSNANQRDLSAIVPLFLELPFPIQLHGRIPLEILNFNDSDKEIIERWNWEAAYKRQSFINSENGIESTDLSEEEIDWSQISVEGEFTRNIDILISIMTWIAIVSLAFLALGINLSKIRENWKFFTVYVVSIILFLLSQASLEYSAMIPRAIGGMCVVWLVAWSLNRNNRVQEDNSKSNHFKKFFDIVINNYWVWIAFTSVLFVILYSSSKGLVQTSSQVIVTTLLIYSVLYSIQSSLGTTKEKESESPTYVPWLLALLAFTFGSLRLWFALLPLLFITLGIIVDSFLKKKSSMEKFPLISMLIIILYGVFFVHRRIFGANYVLEAVETGWPSNWQNILISATLLISASFVSTTVNYNRLDYKKSVYLSSWLIFGLFVSYISSSNLDRLVLMLILIGYLSSLYYLFKSPESDLIIQLALPALAMQILLTWGAWSTFVTMIILSCGGKLWQSISSDLPSNSSNKKFQNILAMAVYPWVIWILWWTLLGQVNGLQTCFEGICPHPRELDPGSIIVRGGYVGFRDSPNLYWMILMISSPIIIAFTMIISKISKQGLDLRPYVFTQMLIVLGCMSVISFSPQYPRLMFSLIWSIFFAIFQISIAVVSIAFNKFLHSQQHIKPITQVTIEGT